MGCCCFCLMDEEEEVRTVKDTSESKGFETIVSVHV